MRDVAEYLDDLGWVAPLRNLDMTVTYHDACHLAHAQRIVDAPRRLLAMVPGLSVKPLDESDVCCGSAGIYNLTQPSIARALQRRKIKNIKATGASAVTTSNPGCIAWIAAGLAEENIEVIHTISLLRRAL